jgi:uncharacterized protein (TIGR02266 family)
MRNEVSRRNQLRPAVGVERRTEPRYSLVEPAQVEVASWTELAELYTNDISHGGLFIRTEAPPGRDTQVAVRMLLPGGAGTLELEGVVVHVVTVAQASALACAPGFGLQFTNLTSERRRALQQLIEHAKAQEAAPPQHRAPTAVHVAAPTTAPAPAQRAVERVVPPRVRASGPAMSELAERSEQLAAGLKRRTPATASPPRDEHRASIDEVLRLVADKDYPAAIAQLELLVERAPEPRLRTLLGMVRARQALLERDFPRARAHYETVLELHPGHEVAKRELLMLAALRR